MPRAKFLSVALSVSLVVGILMALPRLFGGERGPVGPGPDLLVLLVRHAEKATEPADDPSLTSAGVERSHALAAALRDAGVTAIITTQLRRTRETAQPLASATGLTPEVVPYPHGQVGAHAEAVAAAVRQHVGGVVLVVGHANTLPAIIAALGGPSVPECDSAFARLFLLVPGRGEGPRFVRSHYGKADVAPGPGCT